MSALLGSPWLGYEIQPSPVDSGYDPFAKLIAMGEFQAKQKDSGNSSFKDIPPLESKRTSGVGGAYGTEFKMDWMNTTPQASVSEQPSATKLESSSSAAARMPSTAEEKTLHAFLRQVASSVNRNISALWMPQPGSSELTSKNFESEWETLVGTEFVSPINEAVTFVRQNCTNKAVRDLSLEKLLLSRLLRTAIVGLIKAMRVRQSYLDKMSETKGSFTAALAARNSNEYTQQVKGHMRTLNGARWNSSLGDYC